jgi:hypothetical protein
MTDDQLVTYLDDNGYPEHIVRSGRRGLIDRWCEFVKEVESGYPYRLADYRHDLDLRGVMALFGADHDELVREADERLRPLLTGTSIRVWESTAGEPFWDFGYPRNATGEFLADLKKLGIAPE